MLLVYSWLQGDRPVSIGPQTMLKCPQHRLGAPFGTNLAVCSTNVGLDRVDADVNTVGYLLVAESPSNECQDFGFAR